MTYSRKANPNATNSEMDSKTIIKHPRLTSTQRDELIEQYVELVVDNMSTESLVEYAQWKLAEYYDSLSDIEIKDSIDEHDEELYDELVENIVSADEEKEIERLMEDTNDDIILIDSPNSPLFP